MNSIEHFTNSEPVLLSEALYDQLGINYENFKSLIRLGAVYVNNDRQVKDRWVWEKSIFRIHTKPRRYQTDFNWRSLVVYENELFLILNKPSGIPSHPQIDNAIEDSMTQTGLALKMPLYVTHRLDTLTSGLIVYAKKRLFVKNFNVQLLERKIEKKYVALVETSGLLPKVLSHYMSPEKGTPKKLSTEAHEGWDVCKLEILEQQKISSELTWVKINLLTGRTHQIRSQLSYTGAPICGDVLYGSKHHFKENAIALRSCEIAFYIDGIKKKFELENAGPNSDFK